MTTSFSTPLEDVLTAFETALGAAPSLGINLPENAVDTADFSTSTMSHKGVALQAPNTRQTVSVDTRRGGRSRDTVYDTLVVTLNYQMGENHRTSRNEAIALERAIRQRLLSTVVEGVDNMRRQNSNRGYHPSSRGWYVIKQTYVYTRRETWGN